MRKITQLLPTREGSIFSYTLLVLLAFSFLVRAQNLNYNSAFIDEATSIIVGRLGIFQGDWWSYNAFNWMSGNPVMNPALSGITYVFGGLMASRLLSVFFGVLTVEVIVMFTILLSGPNKTESYFAGLIAGIIVAFSPIAINISRMTTYDMNSYYFSFLV